MLKVKQTPTPSLDLAEAVESYKAKANSYLTRLEEADIARAKATRAESLGQNSLVNSYSTPVDNFLSSSILGRI
jgi:hypothetical protein